MKKRWTVLAAGFLFVLAFCSCASQKPSVGQVSAPVDLKVVEESDLEKGIQEYSDELYDNFDVERMLNTRQAECAQMYFQSLEDAYACYAELEDVFPESFGEYNHEFNLVNMSSILLERAKILSGNARRKALEQAYQDLLPVFNGEFDKKDVRIRATALLAIAQCQYYLFSPEEGEKAFQKALKVIKQEVAEEYGRTLATQWSGIARQKFSDFKRICGQAKEGE